MKLISFALPFAVVMAPLSAQTVVIVSAKNPISKLTKEQVSQIFLGQTRSFISGGTAEPLDLSEPSEIRKDFYAKTIEKSPAQMKAHWSKLSFSGKAQPPRSLPPAEVVKLVSENPRYIGYVDAASVTSGVKVVFTL